MPVNVNDLKLPYVVPKIIKSEHGTYEQLEIALNASKENWLASSGLSFVVVNHEHSLAMLKDKRWHNALYLFSENNPHLSESDKANRKQSIINLEGLDHARLRKIVGPVFSPKVADSLRPEMNKAINKIIDEISDLSEFDLQVEVFDKYPSYIISKIIGVPHSDWQMFGQWADDVFKTFGGNYDHDKETVVDTQAQLSAYVRKLIAEKRENPTDDLTSLLIKAEVDGEKLTTLEISLLINAVLLAGIDTTRCQLGLIAIMLEDKPEMLEMLRNGENVEDILEECIRLDSVFRYMIRIASEDIEYNDVLFPKGTIMGVTLTAGNHDESVFEDAEKFIIDRPNRKGATLSFGAGIHYCLGAALARAQMQECMKVVAKRIGDYSIVGEAQFRESYESVWGPRSINIKQKKKYINPFLWL
jgi:cytochrome P450